MRIEERLFGEKVLLVPYERHHVPKYHEWMKDPEILELTASEPLTLEEEFEMRENWEKDDDKLTFIVLKKDLGVNMDDLGQDKEVNLMIGDVNLFFHDYLHGEFEVEDGTDVKFIAEVEVMIAEKSARRNGRALEAITLLMSLATSKLGTKMFIAKIKSKNIGSINLFKKLGFEVHKVSEIFEETSMVLRHP